MAELEIVHPLGQDIEKIHGALLAGFEEHKELLCEKSDFTFTNALDSGSGVSVLVVASWATKNQTIIEIPVCVDPHNEEWLLPLEQGMVEPVIQRVTIRDMLSRGFPIHAPNNKLLGLSPFIRFNIMQSGIYFGYEIDPPCAAAYGQYESPTYYQYDAIARLQGSIGELAILADVI